MVLDILKVIFRNVEVLTELVMHFPQRLVVRARVVQGDLQAQRCAVSRVLLRKEIDDGIIINGNATATVTTMSTQQKK